MATKNELLLEIEKLKNELSSKNQIINSKNQIINSKDEIINSKDEIINSTIEALDKSNKELEKVKDVMSKFYDELRLLRKNLFGTKSDKIAKSLDKILENDIVNDIEVIDAFESDIPEEFDNSSNKEKAKAKKERKAKESILKNAMDKLETTEEVYHSDEDVCPCCNEVLHSNGYQISEKIITVKEHYRKVIRKFQKKVCNNINCTSPYQYTTIAEYDPLYSGTYATSELVASIASDKFVMGLPIYRQAQDFARNGLPINRQTITAWLKKAFSPLSIVQDRILKDMVKTDFLQADETPFKVIDIKTDSGTTKQTYIWSVYNPDNNSFFYYWSDSRSGEVIQTLLKGFEGTLLTDKYSGYNSVENAKRALCLAHARRKFIEILHNRPNDEFCLKTIEIIQKLYVIESENKDKSPDVLLKVRQTLSKSIFENLKTHLEVGLIGLSKTSTKYKAINYMLSDFDMFLVYLDNPKIPIDNNYMESVGIRPVVIGKKNFLFCVNPFGANITTTFYTIFRTAIQNGLDAKRYVTHLLLNYKDLSDSELLSKYLPYAPEMIEMFKIN